MIKLQKPLSHLGQAHHIWGVGDAVGGGQGGNVCVCVWVGGWVGMSIHPSVCPSLPITAQHRACTAFSGVSRGDIGTHSSVSPQSPSHSSQNLMFQLSFSSQRQGNRLIQLENVGTPLPCLEGWGVVSTADCWKIGVIALFTRVCP